MFIIGNSATNTGVVVMAISFLVQPLVFSRLLILQAALLVVVIIAGWRLGLRALRAELRRRGIGVERVLVVGAGEVGRSVLQTIVARPDLGLKAVGFVDDDPERGTSDMGRVPALGGVDNLPQIIDQQRVDTVIITLPWQVQRKILAIVRECEGKHVRVRTVPDLFELSLSQVQVEMLGGIPLLGINGEARFRPGSFVAKRFLDILLTLMALPFALVIVVVAAIAIARHAGTDLLTQERIGYNGKRFTVCKFRSMIVGAEKFHQDLIRQTGEDPRHLNPPTIRASRASGAGSGASAWTSCPRFSTFCAAR